MERQTLAEFRVRLTKALGETLQMLCLFGSRARGEGNDESDLDVLVLTATVNRTIKETIWDIANDLLLETDVYLSPLVMSVTEFQTLRDRERRLALEIAHDGIPL
ncbi:MAG: nucleotidyltransferase domain-containing protein [Deltaproteobacteria bacterium]|nr:nucleotidyltransferase domain-containing protein [Deltaproteobacteria bacterium]